MKLLVQCPLQVSSMQIDYGKKNKKINQFLECSWNRVTLTLQETRSIHDTMYIPKIEFIAIFTFYNRYIRYRNYS